MRWSSVRPGSLLPASMALRSASSGRPVAEVSLMVLAVVTSGAERHCRYRGGESGHRGGGRERGEFAATIFGRRVHVRERGESVYTMEVGGVH